MRSHSLQKFGDSTSFFLEDNPHPELTPINISDLYFFLQSTERTKAVLVPISYTLNQNNASEN